MLNLVGVPAFLGGALGCMIEYQREKTLVHSLQNSSFVNEDGLVNGHAYGRLNERKMVFKDT